MNENIITLYKCLKGRYVKVVWSHKINEIQASLYLDKEKCIKTISCILSVLTTAGAISTILPFIPTAWSLSITAVMGVILSYLTIRYRDGHLGDKAKENKNHAVCLHDLRNHYESLMTDIVAGILSPQKIINEREKLSQMEYTIYKNSPHTTKRAVRKAEKALKINKDSTTEEEEIDIIVPPFLNIK